MDIYAKINSMDMNMLKKVHKKVFPYAKIPSNVDHAKLSIINAINSAADSASRRKMQQLVQNEIDYMEKYNAAYEDGLAGRKLRVSDDDSEAAIEGAADGHADGVSAMKKQKAAAVVPDRVSADRVVIDAPASTCVMM